MNHHDSLRDSEWPNIQNHHHIADLAVAIMKGSFSIVACFESVVPQTQWDYCDGSAGSTLTFSIYLPELPGLINQLSSAAALARACTQVCFQAANNTTSETMHWCPFRFLMRRWEWN